MIEETSEQTFLAPGFRFHPTDEELVSYYLKRKIFGKSFMTNAISEIDIYKSEPWDLPDKSRIKSRDLEWYFFTALDKKHGHGSRTNRATDKGYWKTTGNDRTIIRRNLGAIGMKKTLVFYIGRAPCGERTNWVMHEYRLIDKDGELQKVGINKDAYVLCRIFEKSGSGPKNGEKYGAPFVEEEWDKPVLVPKEEIQCDALYEDAESGHIYFPRKVERRYNTFPEAVEGEYNVLHEFSPGVRVSKEFLEMDPDSSVICENKCVKGIGSSNGCDDNIDDLTQFIDGLRDKSNHSNELDFLDPFDNEIFLDCKDEQTDFIHFSQDLPQPENGHYVELNDFINTKPFDSYSKTWQHQEINNSASHFQPNENGSILGQKDLQDPFEGEPSGFELLDEMLSYFDSTNETLHYGITDFSKQSDINVPNLQLSNHDEKLPEEKLQAWHLSLSKGASSSRSIHEVAEMPTSVDHDKTLGKSFVKKLHNMLESIHAPQAYAVQYPVKPAKSIEHSDLATPINITTQMIRIGSLTITRSTKPSLPKAMNMGFYSNAIPEDGGNFPRIFIWFLWPSGFFLSFLWILILAISFKLASYIYIR